MTYTHKLPPHLGEWPCRKLTTRASDGLTPLLTLVEYAVAAPDGPAIKRIFVDEAELTEVAPPPPPEPADGTHWADGSNVWTRNDLEADAYTLGNRRWFATGSNNPQTWDEIQARHDTTQWTQLIEDPAATAPELPYITEDKLCLNLDTDGDIALAVGRVSPEGHVLEGGLRYLTADEAEVLAAGLLATAKKARLL